MALPWNLRAFSFKIYVLSKRFKHSTLKDHITNNISVSFIFVLIIPLLIFFLRLFCIIFPHLIRWFLKVYFALWTITKSQVLKDAFRNLRSLASFSFSFCLLLEGLFTPLQRLKKKNPKTPYHTLKFETTILILYQCIFFYYILKFELLSGKNEAFTLWWKNCQKWTVTWYMIFFFFLCVPKDHLWSHCILPR